MKITTEQRKSGNLSSMRIGSKECPDQHFFVGGNNIWFQDVLSGSYTATGLSGVRYFPPRQNDLTIFLAQRKFQDEVICKRTQKRLLALNAFHRVVTCRHQVLLLIGFVGCIYVEDIQVQHVGAHFVKILVKHCIDGTSQCWVQETMQHLLGQSFFIALSSTRDETSCQNTSRNGLKRSIKPFLTWDEQEKQRVKWSTIVGDNMKTSPWCRGGHHFFSRISPLILETHLIMLCVLKGVIKYHFFLFFKFFLWYVKIKLNKTKGLSILADLSLKPSKGLRAFTSTLLTDSEFSVDIRN